MRALRFDNRFVRELPADPEAENHVRPVHGACYSRVMPTPVRAPRLLAWSREVAHILGLEEADVRSAEFARVFGGNRLDLGEHEGEQQGRHRGQALSAWAVRTKG